MGKVISSMFSLPRRISNYFKSACQILYLRIRRVQFGKGLYLNGKTIWSISSNSEVILGDNVTINSGPRNTFSLPITSKIRVSDNALLHIGNNVGMSAICLGCTESIEIGDYTIIGSGCLILDTDFHDINWERRRIHTGTVTAKKAPIKIGHDCFIGARCIICKGITIGNRVVVAAGSVVTKNIPDDEIWGGNPAKLIRKQQETNG